MITTTRIDRTIPSYVTDNQLVKLVKTAFRNLSQDDRLQFLELAGLPSLKLESRILSRLVRLSWYTNSEEREAQFAWLLEKGIDAGIVKQKNFLSYAVKRSA